ncbi:MAG: protein translocase SEC61 complex subunit gamma [Candidatus Poseidoniaceae archaeon]|jgi:protein transport protein SEC61 subunit gamma-like protein|nr:protein translocase SEC61 complex subunit gamma [Candidatus Poseidoniaceae archaeon]
MSARKDVNNDENESFEDRVQAVQDRIEGGFRRLGRHPWARILRMARKPSKQEFIQTSIICGIGMFVLGFIGFVILVVMDNWLPSAFEWLIN